MRKLITSPSNMKRRAVFSLCDSRTSRRQLIGLKLPRYWVYDTPMYVIWRVQAGSMRWRAHTVVTDQWRGAITWAGAGAGFECGVSSRRPIRPPSRSVSFNFWFDNNDSKLCVTICPRPLQVVTSTATQSFQLGGHRACRWCGASCSIRIPSLKFIGLPVPKIWSIFGHGVNRPVTLIFDLLSLNGVTGQSCHGLLSCQFSAS